MAEYKKIEDGKVELTSTIDGDKWKEALKKAFNKLSKNLEIKGFRKGQVPTSLAKKYVTDEATWYEAANELSNDAFKDALKEHDIELIDQASMDLKDISADGVKLVFTCPVKPDVKLGDYKSVKYEVEDVKVEDKEVEDQINSTLDRKADMELKEDGTVENGDTATIDFEGFKDGVPFDGGKADNYDLVIGSNSFIPGFEDQLIGMKSEETKDINVTFPENYHVEDLKGQPVVFKVTVHEIKKKVLPELNDEFVKELKIDGVETVDQYKEYVKKNLLDSKKAQAENVASDNLLKKIAEQTEINIPQSMIDHECDELINEQGQRLAYQGISFDQYMKIIGQSKDEIKKELEPQATERIKVSLALEEIAKQEKVEVNQEDIDKHYDELAKAYGMEASEVKKYIPEDQIKSDLKLQKALDLLKNNK